MLDPEVYVRVLPELSPRLPDGARSFATDPEHYNFVGSRCVKDLRFETINIRESGGAQIDVELTFGANPWKHEVGLSILYIGVTQFNLDASPIGEGARIWPASRRLGDIQLDELLPTPGGCSHEIKFTGGSITIECSDLRAEWRQKSVDTAELLER
ncbi:MULTISPECIES: hypothetical protein [Parafrankia]|uniref:hypothetical protein n=1 Tax=Parafrankia TaxID=2994362 RepID=UPI001A97604C|nr:MULTISPECIES: hypothetical protein [Parafrankia]